MSNLTRIAEYNLRKKASAYSDTLDGIVGSLPLSALAVAAPAAAPVANVISSGVDLAGNIHGIIDKQGDPVQELAQLGADPLTSMIPGVAASRLMRRQRLVHKLVAQDPSNDQNIAIHRLLANIVNPLNWVAAPISGLAAAVTDGHTPEERAEVANDPNQVLKTWLIPGYGTYQTYKDLGLSNRVEDIDHVIADLKRSGKHGEAAQYELLAKASKLKSKKKNKENSGDSAIGSESLKSKLPWILAGVAGLGALGAGAYALSKGRDGGSMDGFMGIKRDTILKP